MTKDELVEIMKVVSTECERVKGECVDCEYGNNGYFKFTCILSGKPRFWGLNLGWENNDRRADND